MWRHHVASPNGYKVQQGQLWLNIHQEAKRSHWVITQAKKSDPKPSHI